MKQGGAKRSGLRWSRLAHAPNHTRPSCNHCTNLSMRVILHMVEIRLPTLHPPHPCRPKKHFLGGRPRWQVDQTTQSIPASSLALALASVLIHGHVHSTQHGPGPTECIIQIPPFGLPKSVPSPKNHPCVTGQHALPTHSLDSRHTPAHRPRAGTGWRSGEGASGWT